MTAYRMVKADGTVVEIHRDKVPIHELKPNAFRTLPAYHYHHYHGGVPGAEALLDDGPFNGCIWSRHRGRDPMCSSADP